MRPLTSIRRFADRFPLFIALGLLAVILGLFARSVLSQGPIDAMTPSGQIDITYVIAAFNTEATVAAIMLFIVWLLGWGKQTRYCTKTDRKGVKWAVSLLILPTFIALLLAVTVMASGTHTDQNRILLQLFAFCIMVGIFEETLFRGTLFHGLSRHLSPFWAMMASSVLFGVFHMQNLMVGQDFAATMLQSVNAFALGVVFCAIMLQTNTILWAVALHAIWNTALFYIAYIVQVQPDLAQLSQEDLSATQAPQDVTAAMYLMPLIFLALGLLIFGRWAKRMRLADATA